MAIKTASELAAACLDVAKNRKTLYVMGCFGAPLTQSNKLRYTKNNRFNSRPERAAKILAASEDTFGFDCVCFIKGLLWGWNGNANHVYGGAVYKSNAVPDIGADQMLAMCVDVSEDFSAIIPGELVWQPGHVGIYVGSGMAVEATDTDADGVQIQAVLPMGTIEGLPATAWQKHGKLPWITYDTPPSKHYRITAEGLDYALARSLADQIAKAGHTAFMEICESIPEPAPSRKPAKNDIVIFSGNTHYSNANAESGKPCSSGQAKITRILPGAKHPYHLVRTGKSGPYGWVDANTFTRA